MTAVQIFVRTGDTDFKIAETAHSAIDARHLLANHSSVRNQTDIGLEHILVLTNPIRKARTADFLLSLEHELHVMMQKAAAHFVL